MDKTAILPIPLSKNIRLTVFAGLSFLSFAFPFFFGHSQVLTGTLVNAALIASAILLPSNLFFPIILFPSLAVLSRGIIFGPLTMFLVYFLPIIWLGNLVLVTVFKKTFERFGYFGSLGIAAVSKFIFLFLLANIFFQLHVIPKLFLQTMGFLQLITACTGGILAFVFLKGLRGKYQS